MKLDNGKTYLINHARKGTFVMKIETQDDIWAYGVIVGGKADALLDYNVKTAGDPITIPISFIRSAIVQPN